MNTNIIDISVGRHISRVFTRGLVVENLVGVMLVKCGDDMSIIVMSETELGLSPPVNTILLSVNSSHDHMPMVLNCIVGPSRKQPCNEGPFVAIHSVCTQQPFLFFFAECPPVYLWIQLIKPP